MSNSASPSTESTSTLKGLWLLMRMDKPVGIYLLLWPTLWALWLASLACLRLMF